MRVSRLRGFTLIEMVVTIGIFLIFAVGIYGGTQVAIKVVYNSRLLILESELLNEQVEIIRNMSFYDVGIVAGSPSGVLTRTVTTTRNGIDFVITRTIRNIDDPFDGTIGGTPNDISAADYKLVQMDIICARCAQTHPIQFVTRVAPRYLEGDPTHGALFVQVVDAAADPVQGASVHIVATSTSPAIDLVDTTDNDGMLRLVDLPSGVRTYMITVSKSGYTSDGTMQPTASVPNPSHPPVTVVAQDASEVTFTIDHGSTIELYTENATCDAIANVPNIITGTILSSTNPDIFKYQSTITTSATGSATIIGLDWDTYVATSTGYDVLGTIPQIPLALPSGATQTLRMILGPNTTHSILVDVRDSITGQPLSQASVRVTGDDYDVTKSTGVGFIRQNDWSGGSGQLVIGDTTAYYAQDGNLDTDTSEGDVTLRQVSGLYVPSGQLESSIFDVGTTPVYVNISWLPLAQPDATGTSSLKFQLATANNSSTASWTYLGPDGTSATYYTATSPVVAVTTTGNRYLRYKATLSTVSSTVSPTLSDLTISFTNNCTPPGQAFFGSLDTGESYDIIVSKATYQTVNETLSANGEVRYGVNLVLQ